MGALDANQEATRVFQIDAAGRHILRVKVDGPETTAFQIGLGGQAYPSRQPASISTASQSFLAPSPIGRDGVITGTFPGGDQKSPFYYVVADLKAGDLLSQISYAGRANAPKMLELVLLDARGRSA